MSAAEEISLPTPKKNILISAGGTATAWHLASLVCGRFRAYFNLFVCDINPAHLVASSALAAHYLQVPRTDATGYRADMLECFRKFDIDIYVPLVDADVYEFPADDPELASLGMCSTGVHSSAAAILRNKRSLSRHLHTLGIATPRTVSPEEITGATHERLFVKPEEGFGSKDARAASGEEIPRLLAREPKVLVQEYCSGPEITVEVFNASAVLSICRERLEIKAGVCTKARIFFDDVLQAIAERLCAVLCLPLAFCFQVMRGASGDWVVTDLNPRLGAGTALSTAYGWSLASAGLVSWGKLPLDPLQFLKTSPGDRYVVRVYQERLMGG